MSRRYLVLPVASLAVALLATAPADAGSVSPWTGARAGSETAAGTNPESRGATGAGITTKSGTASDAPSDAAAVAGWPSAGNTGVPAGTKLRPMSGRSIYKDGTVLDSVDVKGSIDVYAKNVTIRNCRVVARGWGIMMRAGADNLRIEYCDIHGNGVKQMQYGIKNGGDGNITIRRNDIHTCSNCVDTAVGIVEDNFVHSPKYFAGDHVDMIMSEGGSAPGQKLTIRNNRVGNTLSQTGAIALFADFGPVRNVLVEHNLLSGGGYSLYGGSKGSSNVVIKNNVFTKRIFPNGGYWGPVAHYVATGAGNKWTGNVWETTGKPVSP